VLFSLPECLSVGTGYKRRIFEGVLVNAVTAHMDSTQVPGVQSS